MQHLFDKSMRIINNLCCPKIYNACRYDINGIPKTCVRILNDEQKNKPDINAIDTNDNVEEKINDEQKHNDINIAHVEEKKISATDDNINSQADPKSYKYLPNGECIIKEGWLEKQSKYIHEWRPRWVVLTHDTLYTYQNKKVYEKPTEELTVNVTEVRLIEGKIFSININLRSIHFKAETPTETNNWANIIRAFKCCIQLPVILECPRDTDYNCQFNLTIPYYPGDEYNYCLKEIISDIIEYMSKTYNPVKFIPQKITADSFNGILLYFTDNNWNSENIKVSDYEKHHLISSGIHLVTDITPYEHKIEQDEWICHDAKDGTNLCEIYAKMRYQDIFTQEYLNHLYEYTHLEEPECKYGSECYSHRRLKNGGNQLQDRCHIAIYRHPPSKKTLQLSENLNAFHLNDYWVDNVGLYYPNEMEKKAGFLALLINEVIENGYEQDLCFNLNEEKKDEYAIMKVVDEKINCMRHKLMGSPLSRAEMLSILLYTGSDCNYNLSKSQRNGNYHKWKWFDYCLYNAISKLSKREYGTYKIYTGLTLTKLVDKYVEVGYFKTYVSTSWIKHIALTYIE
eukprot:420360_1